MATYAAVPCNTRSITLRCRAAADSRGRPTVAVVAECAGLSAEGDCPAGASKGADEAQTVAVAQAERNVTQVLGPLLQRAAVDLADVAAVLALDAEMASAAGANFALLGANAVLPVSRALWRLSALARGEPLWATLREGARREARRLGDKGAASAPAPATAPAIDSVAPGAERVLFFMNIYNGGLHALRPQEGEVLGRERIAIQEVMVVPVRAQSYQEARVVGEAIDAALKAILLAEYGADRVTRADEAGFSVRGLGDDHVAIGHVVAAIEAAGLRPGADVKLALDVAASSFYDAATARYQFAGKARDSGEMVAWLVDFCRRYPGQVLSIEDGLDENDWQGWAKLRLAMAPEEVATIGDDLFVTQLPRLRRGIEGRSASAILIKVNQNGTVGGTLAVMAAAAAAGLRCVVSHRSGETLDDSIADLAVGARAWGLKTGDPQPPGDFPSPQTWVRRCKYLRMAQIEAEGEALG